jgi:hypothetical protein
LDALAIGRAPGSGSTTIRIVQLLSFRHARQRKPP